MARSKLILPRGSVVKRHELKMVLFIAISWVIIDFLLFIFRLSSHITPFKYEDPGANTTRAILLRELNILLLSLIVGFLLVSVLRNFLRNSSLWLNLVLKTLLSVLAAMIMSFFIFLTYEMLIKQRPFDVTVEKFLEYTFRPDWLPKCWNGCCCLFSPCLQ